MTIRQARVKIRYWQRRLGIPQWTVTAGRAPRTFEHLAEISWTPETHQATLTMRFDMNEEDLIHELLHLVIDGHREYRRYDYDRERAINQIAKALFDPL